MDTDFIKGGRVAFTGRLASLSRREAAELVRRYGGQYVRSVTRRTSLLVIGQDGWPLQKDGRLTNKLRKTRALQRAGHPIRVIPEQELLAHVNASSNGELSRKRYGIADLSELLRMPGDRIRRWIAAGLVQPAETVHGVDYFDFQQISGMKTLWQLARGGVKPGRIRRSLLQLQDWLPDVKEPLTQLAILERNGRLLVRVDESLAESDGQLCFDFPGKAEDAVISSFSSARSADDWFEQGFRLEQAGRLADAVEAYRQALLVGGPDAEICFNLGNVLYALGQNAPAAERFRQAVELDIGFVEAWNNLANVLTQLKQIDEAIVCFEKALGLDAAYADAHYGLADLLDSLHREEQARFHWEAYLRQDRDSVWGRHAQRRLVR